MRSLLILNGADNTFCDINLDASGNGRIGPFKFAGNTIVGSYLQLVSSCPMIDAAFMDDSQMIAARGDGCQGCAINEIHTLNLQGFSPGQYASPTWAPGYANIWIGEKERWFPPGMEQTVGSTISVYLFGAAGARVRVFLEAWMQ